jgi:hypothetical protein
MVVTWAQSEKNVTWMYEPLWSKLQKEGKSVIT